LFYTSETASLLVCGESDSQRLVIRIEDLHALNVEYIIPDGSAFDFQLLKLDIDGNVLAERVLRGLSQSDPWRANG